MNEVQDWIHQRVAPGANPRHAEPAELALGIEREPRSRATTYADQLIADHWHA